MAVFWYVVPGSPVGSDWRLSHWWRRHWVPLKRRSVLPDYPAQHTRRQQYSCPSPWQHEISVE
jgi:hypothetical protein